MENVEAHEHTGVDSPKIRVADVDGGLTSDDVVTLTGDQTIAGTKTFSTRPELPASDPTTDNQACRKAYFDGLVELVAHTNLIDSADTERSSTSATLNKKKDITLNEVDGTITVKFDMKSDPATDFAEGRVYKNGAAVGTLRQNGTGDYVTYSEDLAFVTGDLVQLYIRHTSGSDGCYIRNFRLYYDKVLVVTAGTVNTN